MSSEQLAAFVGYDLAQIARSLDVLEGAGVLRRSLSPTDVGRLYNFITDGDTAWLRSLLSTASNPDGRRALIRLLQSRTSGRSERSPLPKREVGNHA